MRDFSEWLLARDIELPMEVVENQENFALVSLLGWFIGIILVIFSVLSIVFFIKNLVEGHLNQIKPNLGTFKAFGLPDQFLISMYSRIVTVLLVVSFGISILIIAVDDILLTFLQTEDTFNVWNLLLWGAIVLLFFSSLYFARRIIRNILNQTPGNLVYGRGNKG